MKTRTKFLDYDARPEPKTKHYCVKCQRDLKPGSTYRLVALRHGEPTIIHPADFGLGATDVEVRPVGMDCARIIGTEWTMGVGGESE